jgi:hypothetical protein
LTHAHANSSGTSLSAAPYGQKRVWDWTTLKADHCVYLNEKTQHINFNVSLLINLFIILKFLNKKIKQSGLNARIWNNFISNSIILFQTQSFSIKAV